MPNHVQTYILHDQNPKGHGGAKRIRFEDAKVYNEQGFGIFCTVNGFWLKRRIENLVAINAWAIDLDKGTKEEMLNRLKKGLIPTRIVETKRGYHAYWKATDGTKENWPLIVSNRLVPFYQADKNAKDLCRILRWPGFYHMKDPANPFLVKSVWDQHIEYTEREMLSFYPDQVTAKKQLKIQRKTKKDNPQEGSFWDKVWNLDCEYALEVLSGSPHVGGEIYDFRPNASGTKQIFVNGKSSSCWIDHEGRIGSSDEGGPTVAQWLNWFHKDYVRVAHIIKEVFPQCQDQMPLI